VSAFTDCFQIRLFVMGITMESVRRLGRMFLSSAAAALPGATPSLTTTPRLWAGAHLRVRQAAVGWQPAYCGDAK